MPIVMSKDEWARIRRWTDVDKEDPDLLRRREYVRYLDACSKEMTKTWPNSVENVNKRNEEMRRARIEAAEQANTKFYKRYVKRQKEQQQRLMYNARDTVFKNKDAPKLLLSAVIETVTQKERIEQLKFNKELKKLAAQQKKRDDEEIINKAKEWHELMARRKKSRFDVNKQHQKEILDQANEISERNRKEYETELNLQKIDNIKANEQMAAIKEFETNMKAAEKVRIWSDMDRAQKEVEARRREQAARDRMDDRLLEVLLHSRARIEKKRAKTELDVKNEKLRVLEKISQKLESGDAAREAKELAILNKAIKEKDDADEARRQAQLRKEAQFKQERVKAREQFLKDEEQRLHEFNTMRQWEIMNRFKNAELYEDFKENLRQEKEQKVKEYREEILRLWREREERESRERADTRHFYGALAEEKLRAADNRLLTHAQLLVEEAQRRRRPPRALHRAIDRYCKMYRLYAAPALPAPLRKHFPAYSPRDAARPDAGYTEPPPPPPDLGPDAPDTPDLGPDAPDTPDLGPDAPDTPGVGPDASGVGPEAPHPGRGAPKRDGIHEAPKAGPLKRIEKRKEESVEDYKRIGKANGLQRVAKQHDLCLPPIKVVPCHTEDCRCQLKQ